MVLWLGIAAAQTAPMTEAHRARYLQAHGLYGEGRFLEALRILDPLTREAPFTLFVLATARAHLGLVQCTAAAGWLDTLPRAWPVAEPPAPQIAEEIRRAQSQVVACFGSLELTCSGEPRISDPRGLLRCGPNPRLDPGIYSFTATWPKDAEVLPFEAEVRAGQPSAVEVAPTQVRQRPKRRALAAGLGAVGIGLAGTSVVLDRTLVLGSYQRFEDARAKQGTDVDTLRLRRQLRTQRGIVGGLGSGGALLLASAAVVFTL